MSTTTNTHTHEGSDKPSVLNVLREKFKIPPQFLGDKLYLDRVKFGDFEFYSHDVLFQEFEFRKKYDLDLSFIDLGSMGSGMGHTIVLTYDHKLGRFYSKKGRFYFKHEGGNNSYERDARTRFYTGLFYNGSSMVKEKPKFDATKLEAKFFIPTTYIWNILGCLPDLHKFYEKVSIAGSFL